MTVAKQRCERGPGGDVTDATATERTTLRTLNVELTLATEAPE